MDLITSGSIADMANLKTLLSSNAKIVLGLGLGTYSLSRIPILKIILKQYFFPQKIKAFSIRTNEVEKIKKFCKKEKEPGSILIVTGEKGIGKTTAIETALFKFPAAFKLKIDKSKDIVNSICSEFLSYDVERKSESSLNILKFIDDQLSQVYNDLKMAETQLESFKKDKNINDNEIVLSSNLVRYSTLEEQMMKVEMEERILDEIQKNITANKNIDVYQLLSMLAGTEEEGMVKDIVNGIQKLLVEKENMLYAVTPNSENIKQVNYQIEIQKQLLLNSLDAVTVKHKTTC